MRWLRAQPYKNLVAIAFIFGVFMDILDVTVVNVALPSIAEEFDVGPSTIEWIVIGYIVSLAVWIPASGWIGDRFGTKKTFMFALVMFSVASALCGAAWNIESLIAFRVLQGVGGGMLAPVGMAMLFRAFPPAERARASAVLAIPTVLAPAVGPVFGGIVTTHASWRWIFYVNVPIGVLGFVFTAVFIKEHKEPTAGAFDAAGFVLSGAGLGLVLYALTRAPSVGWTSGEVLATGAIGLVAFAVLVVVELKIAAPMLDLRLYRDRLFRTSNIVSFMMIGSFLGVLFLLPQYLQDLRGLSPQDSGLTTFPQAIGVMVVARFVGARLYPLLGPRRLLILGLSILALGNGVFVFIGADTNLWWIRLVMFVRGWGMGFAFIPMQTISFATIAPQDTGRASSLSSTSRQVGSAVGVAVLATVLATRTTSRVSDAVGASAIAQARLDGFHDAFFASVIIAVVGIVAACFVRDADAKIAAMPASAVPAVGPGSTAGVSPATVE